MFSWESRERRRQFFTHYPKRFVEQNRPYEIISAEVDVLRQTQCAERDSGSVAQPIETGVRVVEHRPHLFTGGGTSSFRCKTISLQMPEVLKILRRPRRSIRAKISALR